MVEKLLDSFRSGEKDVEEFWLEVQGKFIYIRYIAVRDRSGNYRGTLEVTQDATHIRQLAGEKRLETTLWGEKQSLIDQCAGLRV